ncbi:MAG TPA: methylenetetrahydrofolate reductase [NAD(P)H] [Methylomirabilota bacterium]|nr:methylenetetrahydrofolate reductase [NAD(P)H] [Methylomirabilota bacterium]
MQFIRDIHSARRGKAPVISFEFFPPKTDEGDRNLLEKTIPALMKLKPDFCSVTYGAGGSTRDKTLNIVESIQRQHGLTAMSHLTCVNSTKEQLGEVLLDARRRGIKNILALRGDPPNGMGEFQKTPGGFEFSHELVAFIKEIGGFGIGTAGFPEGHIACKEGKIVDWQRLKQKIDAGADFVITQLFFDNRDFFEFRDHLTKLGVKVPLVPGMLPILSASQIKKFTMLCGAQIPTPMMSRLEQIGNDDAATMAYGIDYATKQCEELLREGVEGLHFYTLNKVHSTTEVVKNLGLAG